jgi:hypothetical protein
LSACTDEALAFDPDPLGRPRLAILLFLTKVQELKMRPAQVGKIQFHREISLLQQ